MPLRCLNHISRVCSDLDATEAFYSDLLGFVRVRRPASFDFEGRWLYSTTCSIGVHLIKGQPIPKPKKIIPRSDHLSFECPNLKEVEELLNKGGVEFVKQTVLEDGVVVTQIFFHDPENNMIEICNCDELPVVTLDGQTLSLPSCKLPAQATAADRAKATAQAQLRTSGDYELVVARRSAVSSLDLPPNLFGDHSHHGMGRESSDGDGPVGEYGMSNGEREGGYSSVNVNLGWLKRVPSLLEM